MPSLMSAGRFLLAAAILAFGIQHLVYSWIGLGLGPPWTPQNRIPALLVGLVLIVCALFLAMGGRQLRIATLTLGAAILLRAAIFYAPKIVMTPHDPRPWTSAFELVALSGASLLISAVLNGQSPDRIKSIDLLLPLGKILFGAALVVFGVQHLLYGSFIVNLIPAWIPGHLFWAYFVGIAFFASALAIVIGKLAPLAATLLGTMFLLWVLILHAPRVAGALYNSDEWTSLFVALAMSGSSFLIAGCLNTVGSISTPKPLTQAAGRA